MSDLYWDPFTPELRNDPYPLWKRMRDEAPVWHNDRYDFWALTRFHDVEAANKDHDTYVSSHGTTVEIMTDEPILDTGMIIWTDPPKHTRLRKLVSRAFTAKRVSSLEDRIREVCADLLDPHLGEPQFDYVQDFSAILPPTMISMLLGVPEGDRDYLRKVVDDIFHIEEGAVGMVNDVSVNALVEINRYLGEQFEDRKRHARDDMFTDLARGRDHRRRRHLAAAVRLRAHRVRHRAVLGRHRDRRPASRVVDRPARPPPGPAGRARRRPLVGGERGGGEPAVRAAVSGQRPLHHARRDPARRHHPVRIEGRAGDRRRGTRRAHVPRPRHVRHPPRLRPAHDVGVRHPLLPGCRAARAWKVASVWRRR